MSTPASPSRARVQAGTVWTNTWMDGFPEVTFGGVKQSGLGREIGRYGLEEFLEIKSLVMRIGRTRAPWVKTPLNRRARRQTQTGGIRCVFSERHDDRGGGACDDHEPSPMPRTSRFCTGGPRGGEAAALNVLKDNLARPGIGWVDMPVAGGGGEAAMTALRARVTAGDPPTAVQMLGFDILDWAERRRAWPT